MKADRGLLSRFLKDNRWKKRKDCAVHFKDLYREFIGFLMGRGIESVTRDEFWELLVGTNHKVWVGIRTEEIELILVNVCYEQAEAQNGGKLQHDKDEIG